MTIKLPDSWFEIKIGQYQEICTIETQDNTLRWVEIIAILTDTDPEKIKKIEPTTFAKMVEHLSFVTSIPEQKIFKDTLTINGVEYKFKERLESLTTGEWIDLEEYLVNTNTHLHKIFALLYDSRDYDKFKDNVNIGDVSAALVFFSLIGEESIKTMKDYLNSEIQKMKTKQMN